MKQGLCTVLWLFVALLGVSLAGDESKDMRRPKKLISTGWDTPDTATLLKNLEEMEKRPFDGVVVAVVGSIDDKRQCPLRYAHQKQDWKREWFQPCIEQMKACKFKRFTDNFIIVNANPGDVDWFDDDGWRSIVDHWRIAAWIAKQGGFKGILFDPEPYRPPSAQFKYAAQPERDKHTFDQYHAQARERGRQVMRAVIEEYPDITLFCYFMDVVCSGAAVHPDPRKALATLGYGLLPPFVDGWFDVIPPAVTVVDGCEMAYMYNTTQQYLESAVAIKGLCQNLVSPENRPKYRAQVQVSFGVYLDAYSNPEGSKYFMKTELPSRLHQLRANVSTALRVADEYVWIYGEKYRWWPTENKGVKPESWPEALPGSEDALRYARDPVEYGRAKLAEPAKANSLANLARNGDFSSDKAPGTAPGDVPEDWKEGRPPAGWHAWQTKDSKGEFLWDREVGAKAKGSARAANVADGCFIQSHLVKPSERYAVKAVRRIQGNGDARIRVRWQTEDGKWTHETQDQFVLCDKPTAEWSELFGVVEVPQGVGRLVILLGVSDQRSPQDIIWYDDVELHKLE